VSSERQSGTVIVSHRLAGAQRLSMIDIEHDGAERGTGRRSMLQDPRWDGRRGRAPSLNVFGQPLVPCSLTPATGFYREGCCDTGPEDAGLHTVCAVMTAEFLSFSKSRGNDLSTPRPEWGFPGLNPGDRWCLCAARWQEALEAERAPRVLLAATHKATLLVCRLEDLVAHAIDAPGAPDRPTPSA
jgi:uncharacterized protein (DUF2237 family)